ncbi:MAG: UTP--glucose-1-phosphate uridylyltransferase [Spirochaetes bacterium]|nr:UTP--glucose-1-phosphate uridylyltransferase [Spirochaetota bacterium]
MKGIIIAAGYGTRFLPASKTLPKEMFPLIDTPAIDFIIDEFIQSGITEILIVTSRRKKCLDDYFDREIELETIFQKENALSKLNKIKPHSANIYFTRQQEMLGTGHAILICKDFIGDSPFVIAYPDDIYFGSELVTQQLIDLYNQTQCSVLAGQILDGDVSRYGVIDYSSVNNLYQVKELVEKPVPGEQPSQMISIGRYLFTNQLIKNLEMDYKEHTKGEFYHVHSINSLAKNKQLLALPINATRIDVGDKLGYLEGIIYYALQRPDLKEGAKEILKKYCQ